MKKIEISKIINDEKGALREILERSFLIAQGGGKDLEFPTNKIVKLREEIIWLEQMERENRISFYSKETDDFTTSPIYNTWRDFCKSVLIEEVYMFAPFIKNYTIQGQNYVRFERYYHKIYLLVNLYTGEYYLRPSYREIRRKKITLGIQQDGKFIFFENLQVNRRKRKKIIGMQQDGELILFEDL